MRLCIEVKKEMSKAINEMWESRCKVFEEIIVEQTGKRGRAYINGKNIIKKYWLKINQNFSIIMMNDDNGQSNVILWANNKI